MTYGGFCDKGSAPEWWMVSTLFGRGPLPPCVAGQTREGQLLLRLLGYPIRHSLRDVFCRSLRGDPQAAGSRLSGPMGKLSPMDGLSADTGRTC